MDFDCAHELRGSKVYAVARVSFEIIRQADSHHVASASRNDMAKLDKKHDVIV